MEKLLTEHFAKCGLVQKVVVPSSKIHEKNHRGYAFVKFKKVSSAAMAVKQWNNKEFAGRKITVDRKIPKYDYKQLRETLTKQIEETKEAKQNKKAAKEEAVEDAMDADDDDGDDEEDGDYMEDDDEAAATKAKDEADEDAMMQDDEEEAAEEKPKGPIITEIKKRKFSDDEEFTDPTVGVVDYNFEDHESDDDAEKNDVVVDEDGNEDNEDADEDEEAKPKKNRKRNEEPKKAEDLTKTVFIRNLPLESTKEEVENLFKSKYGDVAYVAIVQDKLTKVSRGSCFLKFKNPDSYQKLFAAIDDAKKAVSLEDLALEKLKQQEVEEAEEKKGNKRGREKKQEEPKKNEGLVPGLELRNRKLIVSAAVDKGQAKEFSQKHKKKGNNRNLHLAHIGQVKPTAHLPEGIMKTLSKNYQEKQTLLNKSTNFHVSTVRVCVHNLPKSTNRGELRNILMRAASRSDIVKKYGEPVLTEVKILKDNDPKSKSNGISKGYGFAQFEKHEHARAAILAISNKKGCIEAEPKRRLFAEFALDNVLRMRLQRISANKKREQNEERQQRQQKQFEQQQQHRKPGYGRGGDRNSKFGNNNRFNNNNNNRSFGNKKPFGNKDNNNNKRSFGGKFGDRKQQKGDANNGAAAKKKPIGKKRMTYKADGKQGFDAQKKTAKGFAKPFGKKEDGGKKRPASAAGGQNANKKQKKQ